MDILKLESWDVDLPENYTGIAEYPSGTILYYLNGKKHREDGPAVIWPTTGNEEYYINGLLHRKDGPAIIQPDGSMWYLLNGLLHREDGPAIINSSGKDRKRVV